MSDTFGGVSEGVELMARCCVIGDVRVFFCCCYGWCIEEDDWLVWIPSAVCPRVPSLWLDAVLLVMSLCSLGSGSLLYGWAADTLVVRRRLIEETSN